MGSQAMQFAVIGLGPFGVALCQALHGMGHEVMAIDPRADVVQEVGEAQVATFVAQADPERVGALKELDIANVDAVIVARGTDFEASVLIVMNLLDLGVKRVVAKAVNDRHAQVLERIGGDRLRVINPEHDMGYRLAYQLTGQDITEAVWIDPDHSFAEKSLPAALAGTTPEQAQLRSRLGVVLIAVRRGDRLLIAPEPDFRLEAGDRVVLLGRNERLAVFGK